MSMDDVSKKIQVIGKFKDECAGYVIKEVYAIRAKLYHYVMSTKSKHKRVNKTGMKVYTANNIFDYH